MSNLAKTDEEYEELCNKKNSLFAHSANDFKDALIRNGKQFDDISSATVDAVASSLKFHEGQLAHGDFHRVIDEIGEEKCIELFSLFGISPELARLSLNKRCDFAALNCKFEKGSYCSSACTKLLA